MAGATARDGRSEGQLRVSNHAERLPTLPSQPSPEARTKACPVEVLPGGPWGAWQGGPSVCAGISAHEVEGLVEPTRSVELLPLGDPQKRPSALRGQSAEGRVVVATQFQECSWRRGDAAHGNGITSGSLATHTSNKETLATRGARQLVRAGNRGEAHSPQNNDLECAEIRVSNHLALALRHR